VWTPRLTGSRQVSGSGELSGGSGELTQSDEPAESDEPTVGTRPGWWRPRVAWAAALTIAAVVLFLCYLREARTFGGNSDAAGQALQAWQMWHGNPLLRGWWLGDVSFYTVELPLSVVIEMVAGLGTGAIHILAAVVYTAVVLLAALLARGKTRGWPGVARALLAAGIMLAPSAYLGTRVLLQGPDHAGTMIPVLAAFLILDRAPERWWVPVTVGVLLTGAQVNDAQATYAGALAVAIACGVRACAEIARRRRPPRERWFDASLLAAALLSIAAAHLILSAIHGAGGFLVPPPKNGVGFAAATALPGQFWTTAYNVLILFGADFTGQQMGISAVLALLHLVGVALGLAAVCIAVRRFFGRLDRVSQALVAGTLIILGAGAFGMYMSPVTGAHEIMPVLPFAAVLAGRLFGDRLVELRLEPVLGAGLAVMVAALAYSDSQPTPAPQNTTLATWLEAHDLTSGLAGYWESNITTVNTGGRVRLAAVTNGGTTAEPYESDAAWYDPAQSQANFIVSLAGSPDVSPVSPALVRAWYGTPQQVYSFDGYTVMVYDYNLLTRVTVPAGPWQGFRPG
jgi:hypothetical protein